MALQVHTFPVGLFQCNCSIVFNDITRDAIVVDPGDEFLEIWERVENLDLKVHALWHTHAHIDHIGATRELLHALTLRNETLAIAAPRVLLHEGDRWLYENINVQAKMLGLNPFEVPPEFEGIKEGNWMVGDMKFQNIHTPGHTPGSCCLSLNQQVELEGTRAIFAGNQEAKKVIFTGDTLFRRSIGRTDLWGGDSKLILKSIQSKIMTRDPDTLVIAGHGPITRLEEEAVKNPFLQF